MLCDLYRFHAIYWPAFLMAADLLPQLPSSATPTGPGIASRLDHSALFTLHLFMSFIIAELSSRYSGHYPVDKTQDTVS